MSQEKTAVIIDFWSTEAAQHHSRYGFREFRGKRAGAKNPFHGSADPYRHLRPARQREEQRLLKYAVV